MRLEQGVPGNTRSHYPKTNSRKRKPVPTGLFMPTLTVERPIVLNDDGNNVNYLKCMHKVLANVHKHFPSTARRGHHIVRPTDFRLLQVEHTVESPKLADNFINGNTKREMAKIAHLLRGRLVQTLEGVPNQLELKIGDLSLNNPSNIRAEEMSAGSDIAAKPVGWNVSAESYNEDDPTFESLSQLEREGIVHASSILKVDPNFYQATKIPRAKLITSEDQISDELFYGIEAHLAVEELVPMSVVALDPVLCLRVGNRRHPLAEVSLGSRVLPKNQ